MGFRIKELESLPSVIRLAHGILLLALLYPLVASYDAIQFVLLRGLFDTAALTLNGDIPLLFLIFLLVLALVRAAGRIKSAPVWVFKLLRLRWLVPAAFLLRWFLYRVSVWPWNQALNAVFKALLLLILFRSVLLLMNPGQCLPRSLEGLHALADRLKEWQRSAPFRSLLVSALGMLFTVDLLRWPAMAWPSLAKFNVQLPAFFASAAVFVVLVVLNEGLRRWFIALYPRRRALSNVAFSAAFAALAAWLVVHAVEPADLLVPTLTTWTLLFALSQQRKAYRFSLGGLALLTPAAVFVPLMIFDAVKHRQTRGLRVRNYLAEMLWVLALQGATAWCFGAEGTLFGRDVLSLAELKTEAGRLAGDLPLALFVALLLLPLVLKDWKSRPCLPRMTALCLIPLALVAFVTGKSWEIHTYALCFPGLVALLYPALSEAVEELLGESK